MAEGGERRSLTGHRTPGQIKRHGRTYQATPTQKKNRAKRNAVRAKLAKAGRVKRGDGQDAAHKKPLSRGGSNALKNITVQSRKVNRGHGMTRGNKANKP